MKIKISDLEVEQTGTVIGIENMPIDFIFDEDKEFVIRFIFSNDATTNKPTVKATPYLKKGGQLEFINYNNNLGIGNIEPVKIGALHSRELFYFIEYTASVKVVS